MPLPKSRKGASKNSKRKTVSKVIRKLNSEKPSMPKKQKVAIALKQADLSRKKSRKK